jgi:OmpA-OmpF porin, OOP family
MSKSKAAVAALVFVAGTSLTFTAVAQESFDAGWYVGGQLGQADYDEVDDVDAFWSILGGYRFTPYFAVEFGYSDFGRLSLTDPEVGSARISANAVEVTIVGSVPITDRFTFYSKFGAYRGEAEARMDFLDIGAFRERESTIDLTYGLAGC